ncbi:hypothetical protein KCU87_g558, partial [Aureobasidium melanogenum]
MFEDRYRQLPWSLNARSESDTLEHVVTRFIMLMEANRGPYSAGLDVNMFATRACVTRRFYLKRLLEDRFVLFDAIAYRTVKIEHRHRRIWRSSIRVVIEACQRCDWCEVKLDFESTCSLALLLWSKAPNKILLRGRQTIWSKSYRPDRKLSHVNNLASLTYAHKTALWSDTRR